VADAFAGGRIDVLRAYRHRADSIRQEFRAMAIQVETRDCSALTDGDLDDMASMGGAFDIGLMSKAKED
jgi:hypothetical protein